MSDKTGIVEFARALASRGYELISTGGTARVLSDAGLPVTTVSEVTGFPEMMDGRVKTLHPHIHGGILARRDQPADLEALAQHGIALIDIVAVNLYPFEATARKSGVKLDELIEQIDIGGPSLLRAAAKNFRNVLVVVDPADYGMVVSGLDGGWSVTLRYVLMLKAFSHTAEYDATISRTLLGWSDDEFRPTIEPANRLEVAVDQLRRLRYGENPHQPAALYKSHIGLRPWDVLQGKELSYTNVLDLDAAVRIALEFMEPAAVVIKHTNPCGVATADSVAEAYVAARDADPLSAFGGIVGLNRPVDTASADAIVSTFIEAVIAPGVDEAARMILAKKANMRVLTTDFATLAAETVRPDEELRSTLAGVLMQARDRVTEAHDPWPQGDFPKVATKRAPTAGEWKALRFAWRVCAHVKSNAVVFTGPQRTLAIGAGQMSRVDAVNVAVAKARTDNRSLQGSVAASDAFFPFRDGLDAIARAGATAVVQPGGSVRDAEVVAAADEHGIAMVFAGRRHFRH